MPKLGLETEGPLLAVLPGSREAEVRLLAPVFLQAARLLEPLLEERLAPRVGQAEEVVLGGPQHGLRRQHRAHDEDRGPLAGPSPAVAVAGIRLPG